jgi:5-methylcytosine-specific restriction endonuclease McrA
MGRIKKEVPKGTVFKHWRVVKEVEQRGKNRYFLCECMLCHELHEVYYCYLKKKNNYKSCAKCATKGEEVPEGTIFKNWKVMREVEKIGGNRKFLCECMLCNQFYEVELNHLKRKNNYKSCQRCANTKDITGQRFNNLVAVKRLKQSKNGTYYWLFKCDCGNTTKALISNVLNNNTKSCGCLFCGENNPNWKGGVTTETQLQREKIRRSLNPKTKKRDNYQCQVCHKIGGIVSHHIFDFSNYEDLREIESNLITLCVKCHKKFHSVYPNTSTNTLEDLEKFFQIKYKYREELLEKM